LRSAPAARRQFLLLFDLSFTSLAGLARAREAATRFVSARLEPLDLAAVATFSANYGVRMLLGFTTDRSQLRRAIATLGVLRPDRPADPLGLVYDLTEVGASFADTTTGDSSVDFENVARAIQIQFEQSQRQEYRQRILALLEGLGRLGRSLDGLQGRKQVIFLSTGFDSTALVGQQGRQAQESSEALARGGFWEVQPEDRFGDTGVRAEMERALRAFSGSDAVIHTVDLSGLSARGDARFGGGEPGRVSGLEALARIADIAGGRLFKHTNDVGRALDEVLEMSRHYYLIGFEPPEIRGAGHFHKLKVRLRGKGRKVSHRSGYFEPEPFAERPFLTRRFEAAEIIAKQISLGEIEVQALAIPYATRGDRSPLPVVLEIDGGSLLARPKGPSLGLEIYGYALDERGAVEDVVAAVFNLDVAKLEERIRRQGVQCQLTFTLPPGRYDLRFLVRDGETGRSGSRWLLVTLPGLSSGEVQLAPPLFLADAEDSFVFEARSQATGSAPSPLRASSGFVVPRTRPRLRNGRPHQILLLAFDGGAHYDPGAALEIRPQLVDSAGQNVPLGRFELLRATNDGDGLRRFVLNLVPSELRPGEYTFRVHLRDSAGGRVSEAFQQVRVDPDAP
jgi:VWFA-related protein